MTKPMVKENSYMVMERFMMGLGSPIKLMGMVSIIGLMGLDMLENGKMINKKALEEKPGLMVQTLKGISSMVLNKDKVFSNSVMALFTRVSLSATKSVVKVNIFGLMVENMLDSGRITKLMERVY
jgi:hypothetical protein